MTDDTDEPHNHPDPLTHTHDRATSPEAEPHRAVAGADRATNRRGTTDRIRYWIARQRGKMGDADDFVYHNPMAGLAVGGGEEESPEAMSEAASEVYEMLLL